MAFKFTGFADEASVQLDQQIEVLHQVGWTALEPRLVNGTNVCDLTDDEWGEALGVLQNNDIEIVGFGGQIANWARPINEAYQRDVDELTRNAPRMKQAGTRLIRIMSYPNAAENPFPRHDWKAEVVRRLGELCKIAEDNNLILGHENCNGYGGVGGEEFIELVEALDSPAFKLIFDTGNNSLHDHDLEVTWKYYELCREHIVHVHIKAAKPGPDGHMVACYPDEDPIQKRVLADLDQRGYDGWLSIEPHMAAAIHEGRDASGEEARQIWVEYTRRIETLADRVATGG